MPRQRRLSNGEGSPDKPAHSEPKPFNRRNRIRQADLGSLVSGIELEDGGSRSSGFNKGPKGQFARKDSRVGTTPQRGAPGNSGKPMHSHYSPSRHSHNQRHIQIHTSNQDYQKTPELRPLSSSEHTNVSCRFVVRSDSQVSPTSFNVDKPISAKQLWRVFSSVQECPICLEAAEVPRMLGCGHIMCFHCMLKHRKFSTTPDVCPICGEVVALIPSRSMPVTFLDSDSRLLPKEDEEVVLTLMSRPANSVVALPVNLELDLPENEFPDPNHVLWTRVCQGDVEYAKQQMAAEVKYLIAASKKCAAEFGIDEEGYGDAATELKRYIHSINTNGQDVVTPSHVGKSSKESNKHSKHQTSGAGTALDHVYFYQTAFESSVVYTLGALDVSILKAAFGSFDKLPTSLITKICNIEFGIIDRTYSKRLKFLSHLPEQTPVAFLECDWTGVVSQDVLDKFRGKLSERDLSKQRKVAQDAVERQKASQAIEDQFKHEVAEAMLPHDSMSSANTLGNIDTDQLPTLKKNSKATESLEAAKERQKKQELEQKQEFEELMRNAYVPKRGRKDIIIRF